MATKRSRPEAAAESAVDMAKSRVLDVKIGDVVEEGVQAIGTHSGTFHCDEVLACTMLRLLPRFADMPIVRSRDPAVLAKCHVVVDVGGVYDPEGLRFDHHQPEFEGTMDGHDVRLSSAGLVWKHFGRGVVQEVSTLLTGEALSDADVDTVYGRVYERFVKSIDAIDNGVSIVADGGDKRYSITSDLSSRVGRCNPSWNEQDPAGPRFVRAMGLAFDELVDQIRGYSVSWLPARRIVADAFARRAAASGDDAGRVVVMDAFAPWQAHLIALEAEAGVAGTTLFVVYPDSSGGWRVQTVPVKEGSFQARKSLPAPWRGLRDAALSEASGIPDCIFVHAGAFIGGNKTRDGALAMAHAAVAFSA